MGCVDVHSECDVRLHETREIWRAEGIRAYITNGKDMQDAREMTTSIHHRVQVRITNGWPQSGTQTKAVILTIVASPIGKVPYLRVSNRPLSRKGTIQLPGT